MKKKYGCKKGDSLVDSGRWNADDFRHKNIVFENWKLFLKGLASGKYYNYPEQKVFHLSYPNSVQKKN